MPLRCHLLVPALLPPRRWTPQALAGLRLPALETLLARGEHRPEAARCIEEYLCPRFGLARQHDWPIAPLTLRADGGDPGDGYWLRADPVHLAVRRDRLALVAPGAFAITREEADALCASLDAHFVGSFRFRPLHPERWYLGQALPADILTTPLPLATGRSVDGLLPEGGDGPRWRALFNEVQMLLHQHPVNEAREARGALPVNSVWFWGGGTLPRASRAPWARVWSDEISARALALHAGCPCSALPAHGAAWLAAAEDGEHLVVLDALHMPACYDELGDWGAALETLERDWFAPLAAALGRRLAQLRLACPGGAGGIEASCRPGDRWRLWRPRRPLSAWAAA